MPEWKIYLVLGVALLTFAISIVGMVRARNLFSLFLVIPGFVSAAVISMMIQELTGR